jgi:TonB family protein
MRFDGIDTNLVPHAIVKIFLFFLAVVISFALFISIPIVRDIVGYKRPEIRRAAAQRRIIMEVVRSPEKKEPAPIRTMRQIATAAAGPPGGIGNNGISFKITPDLGVEGAGGVEVAMQGQDLEAMVFDESQTDENVIPLFTPSVEYPQRARELGIQGTLEAVVTIDRNGAVAKIDIVKSPHSSISEEAKRVIATWRFKPAKIKGVPVKVRRIQAIEFKLDE